MDNAEPKYSPQWWKRKSAIAIGRPELATASDDELDAAHDAHVANIMDVLASGDEESDLRKKAEAGLPPAMRSPATSATTSMPPGPASVSNEATPLMNEEQRGAIFRATVQEIQKRGLEIGEAVSEAMKLRPDLYTSPRATTVPNWKQRREEESRRSKIVELLNEKIRAGAGDYDLCYNCIRLEHPELFSGMAEPKARK
jgi:hypothetical protein